MILQPPRTTRTDTLFPYTTLFRSKSRGILERPVTAHEKFSESPRSRHYPLSSTPCRGIRHRGGSPMNIHPIRTEADYKAALRAMSAYFDNEPEPGSEAGDRFELLITLVEAYDSSEERRAGNEWVSTCRARCTPETYTKNIV